MAFQTIVPTIYQRFIRNIPANDFIEINCYGRFLTMLANSLTTDPFVSIGGQTEYQIPAGLSVDLNPNVENVRQGFFGILRFRNSTGSTMQIDFALSSGKIIDARVVISSSTTLNVNITGGTMTTPAVYAAGTGVPGAAMIAGAGSTREVIIQNNGANPVWIGDSNVDGSVGRGILLPTGGSIFIITTSSAIYARSTGGASNISYMILAA